MSGIKSLVVNFVDSPIGRLFVCEALKESDVFLAYLGFCETIQDEVSIREEIQKMFPDSDITEGYLQFGKQILSRIEGNYNQLIPLLRHAGATPFQLLVWDELNKIPYGKTLSYSELAELIGKPSAVRAVASACGKNRIAVITPCHRVIAANGSFGGFRWGHEKKEQILFHESISNYFE